MRCVEWLNKEEKTLGSPNQNMNRKLWSYCCGSGGGDKSKRKVVSVSAAYTKY